MGGKFKKIQMQESGDDIDVDIYLKGYGLGLRKVLGLLDQITDNTKFNSVREDLQYNLISLIHYIGDLYPRIKAKGSLAILSKEEQEIFLAFVYLNNQLKHDPELDAIYYEVSGSMYPKRYPYRYGPPGVYWCDFEDHGKSREAKREFYDAQLKKKDVRRTLESLDSLIAKLTDIEAVRR